MSNDPYAACICGSGKKLKFCCQDILADMQRIEDLRENQPDIAEKHLRELYASHPDKEVLVIELAELVLELGNEEEARDLCIDFLSRHQREPRVTILLADLIRQQEGFHESRRVLHRAFQLAQPAHFQHVAMLLASVADELLQKNNAAAAYSHLHRAVDFAPADLKSSLHMLMSGWLRQADSFFPLLAGLDLLEVTLESDENSTLPKIQQLHHLACWEPCAILTERLLSTNPENAELWHNLGLFRLWNDERFEAAEALKRAAELLSDFDLATETQALAMLLDLDASEDQIRTVQSSRNIDRPREVLEKLIADDQFRLQGPESELNSTQESQVTIRISPTRENEQNESAEVLGTVTITANIGDEDVHTLTVSAQEANLDTVWELVSSQAGEAVDMQRSVTPAEVVSRIPAGYVDLDWTLDFDPSLSRREFRRQIDSRMDQALDDWMDRGQEELDGRTPKQVAGDPDMKLQAAAVCLVLYCFCRRLEHQISLSDIRGRLGVSDPQRVRIHPEELISRVPQLQSLRLSMTDLTDAQVAQIAHRATMVRDFDFLEETVEELFRRPTAIEEVGTRHAHLLKAMVARVRGKADDLHESFDVLRGTLTSDADSFRGRLELDLKELSWRLDDPDDPGLSPLLKSIKEQYFQKLPEVADAVREQLTLSGCPELIAELDAPTIVTAGSEASEAAPSAGKLWLPGND